MKIRKSGDFLLARRSLEATPNLESFQTYMAKTHNANAEGKILHSKDILSRTKLNASGDLNLSINVDGQSQYPSVDYDGFGDTYNQLFRGLRPEYWTVEIMRYSLKFGHEVKI